MVDTCKPIKETFSLEDVLSNSEEWEKAIAKRVWQKHIKSNPLWGKACNLNERMESLEAKLSRMDDKLDMVLRTLNLNSYSGRRGHEN
jgi:hypothetical protein